LSSNKSASMGTIWQIIFLLLNLIIYCVPMKCQIYTANCKAIYLYMSVLSGLKNKPWSLHQSGKNKKKDEEIIDKSSWIVIILLHCTSNYGYPVLYYVIWKKWMPYQTFPQISVSEASTYQFRGLYLQLLQSTFWSSSPSKSNKTIYKGLIFSPI
jgi:hypothetical protein